MANKSAKDIAFDKERTKYRKQIRELEEKVKSTEQNSQARISELIEQIDTLEQKILEQNEWIERLFEYTETSKEEVINAINAEKSKKSAYDAINHMADVMGCVVDKFCM